MVNGQLGAWINEAREHGQHFVAAVGALNGVVGDMTKAAVWPFLIALLTAWMTIQVTLARVEERFEERFKSYEERLKALNSARDARGLSRDVQINDIKSDVARLENQMKTVGERQVELITRFKILDEQLARSRR